MAKLDMSHGFVHYIRRHQISRDNYDKEMKEKMSKKERLCSGVAQSKNKRPEQMLYQPRNRRGTQSTESNVSDDSTPSSAQESTDNTASADTSITMADIKFKDENGDFHIFRVHQHDDPKKISADFCKKMSYPEEYARRLEAIITQECSVYFTFKPSVESFPPS